MAWSVNGQDGAGALCRARRGFVDIWAGGEGKLFGAFSVASAKEFAADILEAAAEAEACGK